jgi:hypothetical protein
MAQTIHAWYSGKFQSLCGRITGINKSAGLVRYTSIPVNCPGCLRELLVRGFDENKHELTPQEFAATQKHKSTHKSIMSDVYNMSVDSIVKNTEDTIEAPIYTIEEISPVKEIPSEEWIEPEIEQIIQQKIFSSPGVGEFGVVSPISENNPIIISPAEEILEENSPEDELLIEEILNNNPPIEETQTENKPTETFSTEEMSPEEWVERVTGIKTQKTIAPPVDEDELSELFPEEIPTIEELYSAEIIEEKILPEILIEEVEVEKSLSSKPAPKKKTTTKRR